MEKGTSGESLLSPAQKESWLKSRQTQLTNQEQCSVLELTNLDLSKAWGKQRQVQRG